MADLRTYVLKDFEMCISDKGIADDSRNALTFEKGPGQTIKATVVKGDVKKQFNIQVEETGLLSTALAILQLGTFTDYARVKVQPLDESGTAVGKEKAFRLGTINTRNTYNDSNKSEKVLKFLFK